MGIVSWMAENQLRWRQNTDFFTPLLFMNLQFWLCFPGVGLFLSHWKTLWVALLKQICLIITIYLCLSNWKLHPPQPFTQLCLGASSDKYGHNRPISIGHYKDLNTVGHQLVTPVKVTTDDWFKNFKEASHQNQVESICRAVKYTGMKKEEK